VEVVRSKLQELLLGIEVAKEVVERSKFDAGSYDHQEGRLNWSWRDLGQGS